MKSLLKRTHSPQELKEYVDARHNNLIHVIVGNFIERAKQSDTEEKLADFNKLKNSYTELLTYLTQEIGININECNDDLKTPLYLIQECIDKNEVLKQNLAPLERCLLDLGALSFTYSYAPVIRNAKKLFWEIMCCGCMKKKKI